MLDDDVEPVRGASRQQKADYRLDTEPLDSGGQADVYRAVHKSSGVTVAFKRLRVRSSEARARMAREIEVGRAIDHPHVMPVLDYANDATWFVMPLAAANLEERRQQLADDPRAMRRMLTQVCDGLQEAHARGYVHRDIKPANILLVQRKPRSWAVADWGLVRRPRGQTTTAGRTRVGETYGTEGFSAPELAVDAHAAGPEADVYSLGQLVGWLITGTWPRQNVPLLPATAPWRTVVREATRTDHRRRPRTAAEFVDLVREELDLPPLLPVELAESLLADGADDATVASKLFDLADRHPGDYEVHIDGLPQLAAGAIADAVEADPKRSERFAEAMSRHVKGDWGRRDYKWADQIILFLFRVARTAEQSGEWELLDTAADAMFDWDSAWDQWKPQGLIRPWIAGLDGEAAQIVARSLRRHLDSAFHFRGLAEESRVDRAVRAALVGNS